MLSACAVLSPKPFKYRVLKYLCLLGHDGCRWPSIFDVSKNYVFVFMVKQSVETSGTVCPMTWRPVPVDCVLGRSTAVRTSNLKSHTAQHTS